MVKVIYKGRLGNQMFQYSTGRILAEKNNLYLSANHLPYFENTKEKINGKKLPIKEKIHKINTNLIDLNKNYNYGVEIKGTCHVYDYYKEHKKKIKNWFYIEKSTLSEKYNITKNDVILHYRLGDYKKRKWNLTKEDIEKLIKKVNYNKIFICSDNLEDENIEELANQYSMIKIRENEIETFKLIKEFNKIILSPSTFSWWAAWLSEAKEIIFPWKDGTPWGNKNKQKKHSDLRINDEKRCKIVEL